MTSDDQRCPACGSSDVAAGRFFGRAPMGFLPAGLRFWTFKARPVPFSTEVTPRACTACGLVWLKVDPVALSDVLAGAGTDETKRRFGGTASYR